MKEKRLLILTQKVDKNDGVLGFFHNWIIEFSKKFEHTTVICLFCGEYSLPDNIKVLSLGKEKGVSRFGYIKNFYKYIWHERENYDYVFVHMNPVYVVLGGLLWKLLNKKIGLWVTHKATPMILRLSLLMTDFVFTASTESFGLKSTKVNIVGHAVDVTNFSFKKKNNNHGIFQILLVGRFSPIKNHRLLVEAIDVLNKKGEVNNIIVKFIGAPLMPDDFSYCDSIKKLINVKGLDKYFVFAGEIPNREMPSFYESCDLSINLCPTGGLDKTVLESMACGRMVIVLNKGFIDIVGKYDNKMILNQADPQELADKILYIKSMDMEDRDEIQNSVNCEMLDNFSLDKVVEKIYNIYNAT